MTIWSTIAKGMNLQVHYVLQPTSPWQEKNLSNEEEKIFNEADKQKDIKKIYECVNLEKFNYLKSFLENVTKKNNINFIDINKFLKEKKSRDWLYLDRVHMNDAGYEIVGEELIKNLQL